MPKGRYSRHNKYWNVWTNFDTTVSSSWVQVSFRFLYINILKTVSGTYSYRQGVNMKEIQDILFLICSQIYKQANVLCAYMYTIAGSEQVFG